MFDRTVVLGCGIAGVAAAAALRPYCDEVVIIEQDELPDLPASRRGVPQGRQLHQLLSRAQVHLEELLPGFRSQLLAAGAGEARVADQTHVFELGVHMPERDIGLRLMAAPRPVIEHVGRGVLFAQASNVVLRQGERVSGLSVNKAGVINGVVVDGEILPAQLVVDATGTNSKAPVWLTEVGAEPAKVDAAQVHQWYVSAVVRRPDSWVDASDLWMIFPTPPNSRGGLLSPIGADHWYISVSGRSGDDAPRDYAEMQTYATTLESPWIAELLSQADIDGETNRFMKPSATWRRYDQLARPVEGFLPIGDAVASLNPLFGQGMSVAAWQAAELAKLLGAGREVGELTSRYLQQAAIACGSAWNLGRLVDEVLDGDETLVGRVLNDPDFHRRYVGVWHLLEPVSSLLV